MLGLVRPAVVMILLMTALTGIAYPLAVTGIAGLAFPQQAGGSLVRGPGGRIVGSHLIGQGFAGPRYLHPRGSSAGAGYDATNSSPSNLGPMDPKLARRIAASAAGLAADGAGPIPADAVTQSASGLDPDVSPQNALRQAGRIARARGRSEAEVVAVISRHTKEPTLGFLGGARVNVLEVNLDLDGR